MASDRVTDSLERHWLTGSPLGRGTWGRTRVVRDPQGWELVLKEPLTEADFPADAPLPDDLMAACRAAARQQADLLEAADRPCLPRLESTAELGGGRVGLLLPFYDTLERRLRAGMPLGEVLRVAHAIATVLAEAGLVHGNLRPSNVLFDERGDLVLADAATPALHGHHARLADLAHASEWLPPEARHRLTGRTHLRSDGRSDGRSVSGTPAALWDTWALCQLVHGAVLAGPSSEEAPSELPLAAGGLDKVALAALKDAAQTRLAAEGSNPRFRGRVTDRLGALLARGLSAEFEPSPPYRFATARDLAERLNEVLALLRPRVVEVGRILLPAHAADGVFHGRTDAPAVSFTVTVGCTLGITDHEDLVCGLQLVDLDSPDEVARRPLDDAEISVQVHPSGRLRFQVALAQVPPGRYRIRVAFAVKDSGDEPLVATGEFEVRPPPGYVPPRREANASQAIPFGPPRAASEGRPSGAPAEQEPAPPAVLRSSEGSGNRSTPAAVTRSATPQPGPARANEDRGQVVDLFPRPVAPPEEPDDGPPLREGATADPALGTGPRPSSATPSPSAGGAASPAGARPPLQASPTASAPPPVLRAAPPVPLEPLPSALLRRDEPTDGGLDTEELLADTTDLSRRPAGLTPPDRSEGGARPPWHPPDGSGGGARPPWRPPEGSEGGARPPPDRLTPAPAVLRPDPDLPGPGSVDDLTGAGFDRAPRSLPGPLVALLELVRKDPNVALSTAVAVCLLLVLAVTALLQNC